jgi:hypothetical protein
VNLPDGGGRQGARIEPGKALGKREGKLVLDDVPDVIRFFCLDFVLEAREFVGDFAGEDIQACGEELADLDHDPTHLNGKGAKAAGNMDQAGRAGPAAEGGESNPWQEDIPPDDAKDDPPKKPEDSPVARS